MKTKVFFPLIAILFSVSFFLNMTYAGNVSTPGYNPQHYRYDYYISR